MEINELKFKLNNEDVKFNVCQSTKKLRYMSIVSVFDVIDEANIEVPIEEKFTIETSNITSRCLML